MTKYYARIRLYAVYLIIFSQICDSKAEIIMLRTGVRVVRNALNVRNYANAPAQEAVISATFKVQDNKDFNDRVKNSKVPVIIDFFAT